MTDSEAYQAYLQQDIAIRQATLDFQKQEAVRLQANADRSANLDDERNFQTKRLADVQAQVMGGMGTEEQRSELLKLVLALVEKRVTASSVIDGGTSKAGATFLVADAMAIKREMDKVLGGTV